MVISFRVMVCLFVILYWISSPFGLTVPVWNLCFWLLWLIVFNFGVYILLGSFNQNHKSVKNNKKPINFTLAKCCDYWAEGQQVFGRNPDLTEWKRSASETWRTRAWGQICSGHNITHYIISYIQHISSCVFFIHCSTCFCFYCIWLAYSLIVIFHHAEDTLQILPCYITPPPMVQISGMRLGGVGYWAACGYTQYIDSTSSRLHALWDQSTVLYKHRTHYIKAAYSTRHARIASHTCSMQLPTSAG